MKTTNMTDDELRMAIADAVKVHFRNNHISLKGAAARMGTSAQVIANQLSYRRFTEKNS